MEKGKRTKAKPWPGRKPTRGEREKIKEVEKERGVEELLDFVEILEGKRARPIEKVVESLVRLRMED